MSLESWIEFTQDKLRIREENVHKASTNPPGSLARVFFSSIEWRLQDGVMGGYAEAQRKETHQALSVPGRV